MSRSEAVAAGSEVTKESHQFGYRLGTLSTEYCIIIPPVLFFVVFFLSKDV